MFALGSVSTTIEDALLDADIYEDRLINAATWVDPPEYQRCCRICNMAEREHADWCLITKLLETIDAYSKMSLEEA